MEAIKHSFGYVTDVPYTPGYYDALNPMNINMAAMLNNHKGCSLDNNFTYLELGCGKAVSLCLHAACYPQGHFIGVDLLPQHIAYAKSLVAGGSLNNVNLIERSFVDLNLDEIPECDFIVAHGLLSWVNAKMREVVLSIIDKKLKKGGLVFFSYNAFPGWADKLPFLEMMRTFTVNEPDSISKINKGIKLLESLHEAKALYFKQNPYAYKVFETIKKSDKHYLAHELLHQTWSAFYFHQINNYSSKIGLQYAGSLPLNENILELSVRKESHDYLKKCSNKLAYESLKDFINNQMFRQDVYIRGRIDITDEDKMASFNDIPMICLHELKNIDKRINQKEPLYKILLPKLIQDSISLKKILDDDELHQFPKEKVFRAITYLLGLRIAKPCREKIYAQNTHAMTSLQYAHPMNQYLMENKLFFSNKTLLVSPELGGVVGLEPINAWILHQLIHHQGDEEKTVQALQQEGKITDIKKAKRVFRYVRNTLLPVLVKVGVFHFT